MAGFNWGKGILVAFLMAIVPPIVAVAAQKQDDYVRNKSPSATARAYFNALPADLKGRKISRKEAQSEDTEDAHYTEDGGIYIPPGAMIIFKNAGKCMDPHLPAPASGEPMQFVNSEKLIPRPLRETYETLLKRSSDGDPAVASNNLQHLVWALRTVGTDDPIANNLSESQLKLLDECSGRRDGFRRYHEREKMRNSKRNRHGKHAKDANRVSVGNLSYDASELRGTNGIRRIESHLATLTEMGEKSKETTASDFRYGEIEDELYSDIVCDGGLSFTARILNASEHGKIFRAADFAAQVGNGNVNKSCRQRVTMGVPDEFEIIKGTAQEGVEFDRDVSLTELEGESHRRTRSRDYRRRTRKNTEGYSRTTKERERTRKTKNESTTTMEEIIPVPPVPVVTNEVPEDVYVRVVSLRYDTDTQIGVLTVKIIKGSFKDVNRYVRENVEKLIRKKSRSSDASKIPAGARLAIESISINDGDLCEVRFKVKGI